jgi:serine phosphatase RsbU (regulator of sigma subunit)
LTSNIFVNAQNFADKSYYLVDSLVLEELSESDRKLLDNSLKTYHTAKDDAIKIKALYYISESMMHYDWSKYQFLQHELIKKALLKTLSKSERGFLLKYLASSLNNIGVIYSDQGNIIKALEHYNQSLKIQVEIGDVAGEAQSLNNIGVIYNNQNNLKKALDCFQKSLGIREGLDDLEGIAVCYNNIGKVYQKQQLYEKSLKYYNQSLNIQKKIGNKESVAQSLNDLGVAYQQQGAYEKALETCQRSVKIYEEIGNRIGLAIGVHNIGSIYFEQEKSKKSKRFALRSLKLAKETGSIQIISKAASLLSRILKKEKKGLQALEMFELYILMRDSLSNEATQKASAQQQAKYEYEKQKVIDDASHDKLLAIEQEAKAKQKVITIAIGAGLGLVVVFLIFVFNRLQVTKRQKLLIEEQRDVVEEQRDVVEEAHKEIRDSINYAERIQRSFLATDELLNNNLKDYFVFFQPKDVVSGDFYWAGKLANNNFAVVNADSTGHGVPGAIMSILNISSIEKAIDEKLLKPAEIFNHTRETIIERLSKDGSEEGGKDGMDASIISFDFDNNKFTYTAAQNPIWVIRNNELIEIKGEKMPIGKHDNDSVPFVGGEFETQKGDVIYTITDGFQDQFGGEKGKKFKVRPFKEYLISIAHLPMQEQREKLQKTFTHWKGDEEQVDDVCVIGVRI